MMMYINLSNLLIILQFLSKIYISKFLYLHFLTFLDLVSNTYKRGWKSCLPNCLLHPRNSLYLTTIIYILL